MTADMYIVDAFASRPFTGNPAAVMLLDAFPEDSALQAIAMEMNLSETAFLVQKAPREYDLRWFTPTTEVNLCGHATLASAHVLRRRGLIETGDTVTFHTLSGELRARVLEQAIELDFPELPGVACEPHPALKALGVKIAACEKNRDNYLVEVKNYETLLACAPNFRALGKMDLQGVIVTTAAGVPAGFDFASRYFGPNCGIDEDPVTGSAHCFLAPYWAKKLGKSSFRALQASKRRGIVDVTLANERVLLAGTAVTTLQGQMPLPKTANKAKEAAACS